MEIEAFKLLNTRGFYIIAVSLYHTADAGEITASISTEKLVVVSMKPMEVNFLVQISY